MSSHPAVARFEELALTGIAALIAQQEAEDIDAISFVLGVAAQRLRTEYGDRIADTAFGAVLAWRDRVEGGHATRD